MYEAAARGDGARGAPRERGHRPAVETGRCPIARPRGIVHAVAAALLLIAVALTALRVGEEPGRLWTGRRSCSWFRAVLVPAADGLKHVVLDPLPAGSAGPFIVATISSAAVGLVAIDLLLGYVRRPSYLPFVIYSS